nr:MAG TPA: hypothetical protein [Caudoviricetes sp.]
MDNEFENIVPWNGAKDTGRDVRLKWQRNFERIKANFEEVLKLIDGIDVEEFANHFLRKDQDDSTEYLLSLLGGVIIDGLARFGDFITGVSGAMIEKNGDAEFRSIYARKRIFTPEVAYNRVTYIKGKFIISPGGGCTVDTVTDNGDGTYTIKPDLTDADGLSQFKDDILTTYFVIRNEEGKLNGFEEMKFRVMSADFSAKTFVLASQPGHDWAPVENMVLAQTGNFIDPDRQTYTIIDVTNGNNCITFFEHANTWDPEPAQMPGWLGKKKGMVINGINCDNYSAVLQQVLITGLIFQIDEITGESVRVPIWKGEWVKDKKYGYFNEVSHKGSRYLCINPEGTEEEPGTGQDWLITVEKGQQGDPGLSVVGGGHWESSKTPYEANTLVSFYNCVFISNVKTSNPPIAIARFKDGSYIRQKNGGYILAGRSADFTVHPDWTMLLDGRELKGTSITFLGSLATAPSNPVEGNSYYNTTDKCTYIYQNGQWMLMVSDGKDGRDYEYIYTRNNSIGITPDKPDSKQQDDYVPEGWTDDYLGVSETFQVEWGCKRTKRDGVWSEWSEPAIVHRWSKDGENAVIADLDNEMVNCALTSDGKTSKAQSWVTNVAIWYGYESLPLESISTTQPSGITVSANKNTGAVTVSVAENVALAETNDVVITLTASKNGQNFERQLTFTIAGVRAGADGSDGADAVLYSLVPSVSSVAKYKDGSYSVAAISCTRQKTVGESIAETTDGELRCSIDGGAEQTIDNDQEILTTSFSKSVKFIFYVGGKCVDVQTITLVSDGVDGENGLSVVGGGHWESSKTPYEASTLVSMFNCVFMSNVRTSNPPLSIMKFKDGSYARTKLGYILAGRSADFAVHPDWTMLLDGRELKGTSITFLGSFATAPSNPSEGNSYYNTTDKCTYIYQNGQWMLMVSDGKDGRDYEYIYTRNNSAEDKPEKPDSQQQDDYVPSGWTDNYMGVSETFQIEWACKRTKKDGVWSEWSDPAPIHRWSKDGENAVIADLDNEMVSCALTADGKVTLQQSWTTNVTMWYGYEELELTALTTSQPSGLTVQSDKSSGAVTVTATAGVSLAETNNVIITLSASKNGQNFERQLTFTIAGVRAGADGADAVIYNLVTSASSVTKYKDGTYSVASISCTRWKSAGSNLSATQDGELKYSLDGGAEQTVNNGQSISSSSFSKSVKFLFYVDGNLVDVETIPMLAEAKDGESAVSATITNEMVNCALTADGKVSKDQVWTTQVTLWYGTEKLPLASITASQPSGMTVQTDKSAGTVTASVKKDVSMSETTDITIILTASRDGQDFQRQMTFTIAGVRAGADGSDGADAVLYSLVPSVSSVAKYKDGTYSASTVSCKRQKAVGDSIADTTDGELKYSRDGGVETNYTDGTAIATTSFTRSIKFLFYVGGKLVDVETIPMLSDGADGHDGQDGSSIEAVGHWEASQVPYAVNKLVNFGRGTFVALEETSEPPLPIARFKDGTYMRKKDGGYILAGRSADMTVNPSWRMISWSNEAETLYWLDCPISAFSYTSTGSPSPSSVEVTCKMSRGGSVSDCVTLWLAARRYNGSWVAHVGATQSSKIYVPATAGYTQFVVRAYKSSSDASAWNSNYVAERGIGVAQAGKDGTDYEYIFQRTTTNSCPSTPATAQQDDYVPSGWTPDPQGVSDTYPYEWASMRTKNDGTWGAFCTPYAYGVKGADGLKGDTGATGAFPYDRGVFKSGQSYVWNSVRRDKVIHLIGGVYYNFLVKNYGATVTAAPTSASGDSNWEAMQKFESIVTDTFFADGANIGGFMFKLKGYTSDGIPYGELRSQQADGNGTPNFYVDTQTGKVYACVAEIKGTIEASSGKIGGMQISGNSLTNINGNNDAGIYLRNSTEGTFAAMGGNVVPSVGGFTMIADFENTKRYDLTDISSINYGLKLLAQNARTNIALTIDGGCVQGFAMRNTIVNTDITSKTLTRNDYNVICNNTGECTITLPSMQLYDDGHVIRIKRLNGNVLVKTSYCYVIDPETYTSKYVRPIIIYSDSQAVTGSSSNNLTMNTKGDGTELVWVRDYIGTVKGTTYYGAWIANKISYM